MAARIKGFCFHLSSSLLSDCGRVRAGKDGLVLRTLHSRTVSCRGLPRRQVGGAHAAGATHKTALVKGMMILASAAFSAEVVIAYTPSTCTACETHPQPVEKFITSLVHWPFRQMFGRAAVKAALGGWCKVIWVCTELLEWLAAAPSHLREHYKVSAR